MRVLSCTTLMVSFFVGLTAAQEQQNANASCTFESGHEISVRYNSMVDAKQSPPFGKVWGPGDAPLLLFMQSAISLNKTVIPAGAYSVYLIPGKKDWTLIINKDVTVGARYDQEQDVARATMDAVEISQPTPKLSIGLGHVGPKQCSLRVYFGKMAAWTEFTEQ